MKKGSFLRKMLYLAFSCAIIATGTTFAWMSLEENKGRTIVIGFGNVNEKEYVFDEEGNLVRDKDGNPVTKDKTFGTLGVPSIRLSARLYTLDSSSIYHPTTGEDAVTEVENVTPNDLLGMKLVINNDDETSSTVSITLSGISVTFTEGEGRNEYDFYKHLYVSSEVPEGYGSFESKRPKSYFSAVSQLCNNIEHVKDITLYKNVFLPPNSEITFKFGLYLERTATYEECHSLTMNIKEVIIKA